MLLGARMFFESRRGNPPLPYDYAVEYIETDGLGAYINTGIVPVRGNSDVAVSFNYVSWNTSWVAASNNTAFGARGGTLTASRAFELSTHVGGGVFRTSNPTATISEFSVPLDHNIHDISLSYSGITFDGIGYSNSSSTLTQPVGDFCLGSSGTLSVTPSSNTERYFGNVRFYSCKIYTNGALLFDGIPVVANGVAGMYDSISGTVKTNAAATGTITAGPRV